MLGTAAATDMPMLAQNVRRQPEYIYSCMYAALSTSERPPGPAIAVCVCVMLLHISLAICSNHLLRMINNNHQAID